MCDLDKLVSTYDYEKVARAKLTNNAFDYYASGANDEITLHKNISAYQKIELLPRVLVDTEHVDTSTTVLGTLLKVPIIVAPMAVQAMAHPDSEIGVAQATKEFGSIMCLSCISSTPIEVVANAMDQQAVPEEGNIYGGRWFQLYLLSRRDTTEIIVKRAEQAGYSAIVVTVDSAAAGKREQNFRNMFTYPPGVFPANFVDFYEEEKSKANITNMNNFMFSLFAQSVTWKDIEWLKSITKLPIILKGIVSPQDAKISLNYGISGIIISNHGGRQLDTVPGTISCLPEIAKVIKGSGVSLIIDGGVRRGTDIVKAIALGASCVMVGRPILWGLAVSGKRGVSHVLEIFRSELVTAMKLCGVTSISQITKELILDSNAKL